MEREKQALVTVTIDGMPVSVPEGTTILEAAERLGVVIPRYCYHPGLSAPAVCRMCLVEVEGAPKPAPSCDQQVQDRMIIHTASPEARKARRAAVEFLLVNHPLDCPICDAAGQCELQDYAFETGQLDTRNIEPKAVLGRGKVTPDIVYFADRCILCTRCVRFMDEVAQEPVLQVISRGHRGYIDTMTGELFEHPFSMNIVDVCPVGALVNEDFLFKARAWDLDQTASICPGCSQGCNIVLGTKENRVLRAKPRPNSEVNSFWMCDHGRKAVVNWGAGERVEVPMARQDGRLTAVDWARALDALTEALRGQPGGGARAIVSAGASNESLYTIRKLMDLVGFEGGQFRITTGREHVLRGFPKLALRKDRAPNGRGAGLLGFERADNVFEAAGQHTGVLFVLEDTLEGAPEDFGADAALFVYVGSMMSHAARVAHIVLPSPTFAEMEGTFTSFEGRVQRFDQALRPPGVARPIWLTTSVVLERLGGGPAFRSAGAAFASLAADFSEYDGLSYEGMGLRGAAIAGARPAAVP
jgi:NADH-quinone oxidoreductase subunit G